MELKKVVTGFIGSNRFEDGDQSLNLPSQAIEQWLDVLLSSEEIKPTELPIASISMDKMKQADSQASKASIVDEFGQGIGKFQKVSDTKPASQRYGLDF